MNKILQYEEALEIARAIVTSYGFDPSLTDLERYPEAKDPQETHAVCNVSLYETKFLFWKKTERELTPVVYGQTYEDALLALEEHLKGAQGQGRVDKANILRERYIGLLLDKELSSPGNVGSEDA